MDPDPSLVDLNPSFNEEFMQDECFQSPSSPFLDDRQPKISRVLMSLCDTNSAMKAHNINPIIESS